MDRTPPLPNHSSRWKTTYQRDFSLPKLRFSVAATGARATISPMRHTAAASSPKTPHRQLPVSVKTHTRTRNISFATPQRNTPSTPVDREVKRKFWQTLLDSPGLRPKAPGADVNTVIIRPGYEHHYAPPLDLSGPFPVHISPTHIRARTLTHGYSETTYISGSRQSNHKPVQTGHYAVVNGTLSKYKPTFYVRQSPVPMRDTGHWDCANLYDLHASPWQFLSDDSVKQLEALGLGRDFGKAIPGQRESGNDSPCLGRSCATTEAEMRDLYKQVFKNPYIGGAERKTVVEAMEALRGKTCGVYRAFNATLMGTLLLQGEKGVQQMAGIMDGMPDDQAFFLAVMDAGFSERSELERAQVFNALPHYTKNLALKVDSLTRSNPKLAIQMRQELRTAGINI
ncbi:MAG: hypothetical protein O3A01_09170 [bacterium]|nr:hypothetical protein [bacterium]